MNARIRADEVGESLQEAADALYGPGGWELVVTNVVIVNEGLSSLEIIAVVMPSDPRR